MLYDYFLIIFILISFIYGIYRGIKRELSFFIILSIILFGVLLSYNTILEFAKNLIDINQIYESLNIITKLIPISSAYFTFIVFILLPIILLTLLLNGIAYLIFFKRKYTSIKKLNFKQRFFGGLLGILVGLEMSILMMIVLNGIYEFELNGPITNLIINYLPNINQIITETSRVLGSEA